MRSSFFFGLMLAFSVPATLQAQAGKDDQIKPAAGVDDKKTEVSYPVEKGITGLKHGQQLSIAMKGGTKVEGTLVRLDPKGDAMFIRTEPGVLPRRVEKKDINEMRFVAYGSAEKPKNAVVEPEIQAVVIVNGGRRSVTYSAPNLSPGELSLLQNVQSAEDDLYRLERMADRENQVMENVLAIQDEQRKSIELTNRYQELLNLMVKQRADNPFWWQDQYYFAYYGSLYPFHMYSPNLTQPFPIIQQQGPIVMPDVKVSHESLAKARQNLASLQAQTVYERSRLVAVVVKD